MCLVRKGTEKRGGVLESVLDTSGYTQALTEGWKQRLVDRCLPTGTSTHTPLTLEE